MYGMLVEQQKTQEHHRYEEVGLVESVMKFLLWIVRKSE